MTDPWFPVVFILIAGLIVKSAVSWFLLRYLISTYILAGKEIEVLPASRKLLGAGYSLTSDHLGEFVKDRTKIPAIIEEIRNHIIRLGELKKLYPDREVSIAIKPSRIGAEISEAHFVFYARLICSVALVNSIFVWFDAEKKKDRNLLLNGARALIRKKRRNFGVALQSAHSDSRTVLDQLIANDIAVRIVKGAYDDGDIKDPQAIRENFLALHRQAKNGYRSPGKIAVGTCDSALLQEINDPDIQYQFLFGVRSDLQEEYLTRGFNVLIYFVWGPFKKAPGYLFRRIREGAKIGMLFNFVRNIFEARRFRNRYGI